MQVLSTFTNTELKKIINVYQLDYINGKSQTDLCKNKIIYLHLTLLIN